jgi:hypothetical protein
MGQSKMFVGHGCSVLVVLLQPGDGGGDGSLRREPFTSTLGGVSSKRKRRSGFAGDRSFPGSPARGGRTRCFLEEGCSLLELFLYFSVFFVSGRSGYKSGRESDCESAHGHEQWSWRWRW